MLRLKGVAGVGVYGSTGYALRVWLDSNKMAARGITVADIKSAISSNTRTKVRFEVRRKIIVSFQTPA